MQICVLTQDMGQSLPHLSAYSSVTRSEELCVLLSLGEDGQGTITQTSSNQLARLVSQQDAMAMLPQGPSMTPL